MPDLYFNVPAKVLSGVDTINRISSLVAEFGKRAMLVTEAILYENDTIDRVQEFLDKKGEGIQHIGFMVDDIEAETAKLAKEGYKITQSAETPTVIWAYYGTDEVGGFSIELMQKK